MPLGLLLGAQAVSTHRGVKGYGYCQPNQAVQVLKDNTLEITEVKPPHVWEKYRCGNYEAGTAGRIGPDLQQFPDHRSR